MLTSDFLVNIAYFVEQITNPSKYRVDLRFFAELLSVGLFNLGKGLNVLAGQLSFLTLGDKEEHNNLTILTSFCKHCGDDYARLLPRKSGNYQSFLIHVNAHTREIRYCLHVHINPTLLSVM